MEHLDTQVQGFLVLQHPPSLGTRPAFPSGLQAEQITLQPDGAGGLGAHSRIHVEIHKLQKEFGSTARYYVIKRYQ